MSNRVSYRLAWQRSLSWITGVCRIDIPLFRLVFLFLLLVFAGCAHYPVNQPLRPDYQSPQPAQSTRADDLLVVLSFSGGGSRASALSFGVLKALAETEFVWHGKRRRLLDEIDVISAVSGGSFTAAHFALRGDRMFETFEQQFLHQDIDGNLVKRLFYPRNWFRLASLYFNRSELAEEYYDDLLFGGATFGDLDAGQAPVLLINATDITLGDAFTFDEPHFNLICSRLDSYPLSRAVTASSAVPGIFSTITLANYAGGCRYALPNWVDKVLNDPSGSDDRLYLARKMTAYAKRDERPFIHLLDGGLADNLGLRALLDRARLQHGNSGGPVPDVLLDRNLKKVLVIVVNAAAAPDTRLNRFDYPPSIAMSVDIATTVQVNRYNDETLALFRDTLETWQRSIRALHCGAEPCDKEPQFYLVDASLARLEDADERIYLQTLPTSFSLDENAIGRLIEAGRVLLRDSPQMEAFKVSVQAKKKKAISR